MQSAPGSGRSSRARASSPLIFRTTVRAAPRISERSNRSGNRAPGGAAWTTTDLPAAWHGPSTAARRSFRYACGDAGAPERSRPDGWRLYQSASRGGHGGVATRIARHRHGQASVFWSTVSRHALSANAAPRDDMLQQIGADSRTSGRPSISGRRQPQRFHRSCDPRRTGPCRTALPPDPRRLQSDPRSPIPIRGSP